MTYLWKIWVRQLGWWHSHPNRKKKGHVPVPTNQNITSSSGWMRRGSPEITCGWKVSRGIFICWWFHAHTWIKPAFWWAKSPVFAGFAIKSQHLINTANLVMTVTVCELENLKMAINTVDFPRKSGGSFHSYLWTRKPEGIWILTLQPSHNKKHLIHISTFPRHFNHHTVGKSLKSPFVGSNHLNKSHLAPQWCGCGHWRLPPSGTEEWSLKQRRHRIYPEIKGLIYPCVKGSSD